MPIILNKCEFNIFSVLDSSHSVVEMNVRSGWQVVLVQIDVWAWIAVSIVLSLRVLFHFIFVLKSVHHGQRVFNILITMCDVVLSHIWQGILNRLFHSWLLLYFLNLDCFGCCCLDCGCLSFDWLWWIMHWKTFPLLDSISFVFNGFRFRLNLSGYWCYNLLLDCQCGVVLSWLFELKFLHEALLHGSLHLFGLFLLTELCLQFSNRIITVSNFVKVKFWNINRT